VAGEARQAGAMTAAAAGEARQAVQQPPMVARAAAAAAVLAGSAAAAPAALTTQAQTMQILAVAPCVSLHLTCLEPHPAVRTPARLLQMVLWEAVSLHRLTVAQ